MQPVLRMFIFLCLAFVGAFNTFDGAIAQSRKLSLPSRTPVTTSSTAALPELPRFFLDTTYAQPSGRILHVGEGGDLQETINNAQPGDVITLQPGAVFLGNFELPPKNPTNTNSPNDWIIIRPATSDYCIPQPGNRITPESAGLLPKIISPNAAPAIATMPGAHHYRLIGLEVGVIEGEDYNVGLVLLGDGSDQQNSLISIPHDLVVDRCYIHGNSTNNVTRGIALNSSRTSIIDSYISDIHGIGFDTQAIGGWNGPGPFKIENNYLEAAGENIIFGGADPAVIGLIPSDIEIRGNHFFKPSHWRVGAPDYAGLNWSVKNLLELKCSQRVLIEGNLLENNWSDAQDGFALVFKSVNQDGAAPWSVTRDVTFINNIVRNSDGGINLLGTDTSYPTDLMRRVLIKNNLWVNIDGTRFGGLEGRFLQLSDTPDVTVDHNTILHTGSVVIAYGNPNPNFVYTNNLSSHNEFGVKGDGEGTGNDTLRMYMPNVVFSKNVLAGGQSDFYPPNNFFPAILDDVRFVDPGKGIYRLAATSPYKAAGIDGKDLGCDFDALGKAMSKTVTLVALPSHTNPSPKLLCGRSGLNAPTLTR